MNINTKKSLIEYLSGFTTSQRLQKINDVLDRRTRHLTVVLEDIYQPHNASAVLRSCDCFGVQDVHIIENEHSFSTKTGVTIGADRWLTLYRYREPDIDNTETCISRLKEEGYQIVATTPHGTDRVIGDLPADMKTALLFGTELDGLSRGALILADEQVKVPIYGFSESYNISVSAALCLYDITERMRKLDFSWGLSENEKISLRLKWLKHSVRAADQLVERFLENNGNNTE